MLKASNSMKISFKMIIWLFVLKFVETGKISKLPVMMEIMIMAMVAMKIALLKKDGNAANGPAMSLTPAQVCIMLC